jgi:hypothetical protein
VVFAGVADVGDSSGGEGDVDASFVGAVVVEGDGWWPAELVSVGGDEVDGVAGPMGGRVVDRPVVVGPVAGFSGAGFEFVEGGEADSAAAPAAVT